jgi:hypothetical protein
MQICELANPNFQEKLSLVLLLLRVKPNPALAESENHRPSANSPVCVDCHSDTGCGENLQQARVTLKQNAIHAIMHDHFLSL